jgi:ABC-2 type transport system ATP-binding protein
MSQQAAIEVIKLVKKFGSFIANDNLSFSVGQGEIFGFLGANGAGKTTAMKILCGLSKPTSGIIRVAGYDVARQPNQVKKNIGYMSQRFSLYNDLTVKENFRFFGGIYGLSATEIKHSTDILLERLGLAHASDKLLSSIPTGWKQKLAFSVAIMHNPRIVFLDEPTGGVDPITRRQFWELIYEASASGITVFVTTHYMDEAEYCQRVCILVNGRIEALESPGKLKEDYQSANMHDVFLKLARK